MKIRLLPLLIAASLAAGAASASDKTPAPDTPKQQAARAEIDRLVKRIEELSTQLGDDGDVRVIVRKGGHDGPGWHGRVPGDVEDFEFDDGDGKRKVMLKRLGPGEAPMALPEGGKWKMQHLPDAEFGSGPGLGIVMSSNPAAGGVRIAAVTPDSPAMRAGIRTGDVVLQVNGKSIAGAGNAAVENARAMIGDLKQGQVVKLRYARQGKTHDANIKADEIRRVWAYSGDAMAPKARGEHRGPHFRRAEIEELLPPGVEMEVQRIGSPDCDKGRKDCGLPVIYEAFRWQGLNLASLDAGLGRYFGTQDGVLVLSSSEDLKGLQSGDVIQKVGGSAVDSPRDVMRALRGKDSGAQLRFDLLRDRKPTAVTVTVPKSRPLPFITPPPPPPAPPAPPMAPRAPRPPHAAPMAPPPPPGAPRAAPPAPPAPPTPPAAPDGSAWIERGDGAQVWIARGGETPEAIREIEVVELPAR